MIFQDSGPHFATLCDLADNLVIGDAKHNRRRYNGKQPVRDQGQLLLQADHLPVRGRARDEGAQDPATLGGPPCLTATHTRPLDQLLCHCSACKRLSGSLFALHYPIPPTNFAITSGQPKTHKFVHPAGPPVEAAFCGNCGTWLYKQVEANPFEGFYLVQAGTTDLEPGSEANGYWTAAPEVELWVTERAPWLAPVEGAEQRPGL